VAWLRKIHAESGRAFPDPQPIIGRHCVLHRQLQSLAARKAVQLMRIPDAAVGIASAQELVELRVALTRVRVAIAERSVNTQHARTAEHVSHAAKKILHRTPTHDVQRVGGENSIYRRHRPRRVAHVELEDRAQIRAPFLPQTLAQCGKVIPGIARLPREVRQMGGEVQRVLSRAAADLQYMPCLRELSGDNLENRRLVALGGVGYGIFHDAILRDNGSRFLSQKKVTSPMQAIEALLRRYSARSLTEPAPDEASLGLMFESASRAPDHGRLRPWRFIVIRSDDRPAFGELLADHMRRTKASVSEEAMERERRKAFRAPLIVVVAAIVTPEGKIPAVEQILSAGVAAQNMLQAAFVLGFNAVWKTGGAAYDEQVKAALGLESKDAIVGFMYMGTDAEGPGSLPRPDWRKFVQYWPTAR
jgi:nitroreductase